MLPLPPMVTVFGLGTAAPARMARRGPPAGFMIPEYPRHIRPGMFRDHETAARATGRDHTPAGAGCPAHPGCLVPGCITVTPDRHPGRPWTTTPGRPWTTTPETSRPVRPRAMLAGRGMEPCGCNRAATVCRIHLAPARRPAEPSGCTTSLSGAQIMFFITYLW